MNEESSINRYQHGIMYYIILSIKTACYYVKVKKKKMENKEPKIIRLGKSSLWRINSDYIGKKEKKAFPINVIWQ